MEEGKRATIMEYFGEIEDPRIERCQRHKLLDIIAIAICATICGADNWSHIALFGRGKEEWLRTFLELPNGIPSHDTFGRVFSQLDPEEFQRCFMEWTQGVADLVPGEVVAIDGKTARRSHDGPAGAAGKRALHLVSAWASANTLTLGQVQTEEKSNEITAIPKLLEMLELEGCIVTIDAMGCQKEIAQGILDRGADYVLAVKQNQGRLYEDLKDLFEEAEATGFEDVPHDYATTLNKNHGRLEKRECWVITDPECLEYLSTGQEWPGLRSVVKVVGRREAETGVTVQPRYFISSLEASAEQLLATVRAHWSIECSLNWSLDVTFKEDKCRIRKDHGPQNMATLRNNSHNLLKRETSLESGYSGQTPLSRLARRLPA